MTFGRFAALTLLLAIPAAAPAAAPTGPGSLVVSSRNGFVIPVSIEGKLIRLRVDPAVDSIVLNPGVAARLGLKPAFRNSILRPLVFVGPARIKGTAGAGRIAIGSWSGKRSISWFERDITSEADGLIGVADLPHERVTMELRPAASGDGSFTYAVDKKDWLGLVHTLKIGGKEILTRFSFHQRFTQASAAAGAVLAAERRGTWAAAASPRPILFGVSRPTRLMAFQTPLSVNGLIFERLLIRTSDHRGGYRLPTDPPADPNEIVVTGKGARSKAHLRLTISEDRLSACSGLTYVGRERRLTLVCPYDSGGGRRPR